MCLVEWVCYQLVVSIRISHSLVDKLDKMLGLHLQFFVYICAWRPDWWESVVLLLIILGQKKSDFSQLWGSKLPSTQMRYFAQSGLPSLSRLFVLIAMVGSVRPRDLQRNLYLSSLMSSHISKFCKPLYSSLYYRSHIFLSDGRILWCWFNVGLERFIKSFALTFCEIIL